MLNELMPENLLWLNQAVAERMGIVDGEDVEVSANGHSGRIKAKVTKYIHPEAVFMVHGFGHTLPNESRAFGKGILDNAFMQGGLAVWDQAGGGMAMQEHFVSVRKPSEGGRG
jgi:thiosulfate reductase / polysulfide reductase chain A